MLKKKLEEGKDFKIRNYCWAKYLSKKQRKTAPLSPEHSKILNDSMLCTTERPNIDNHENHNVLAQYIENFKKPKVFDQCLKLYNINIQFYKNNEEKLLTIIRKQLKNKNYQQANHIITFLKVKKLPNNDLYLKTEQEISLLCQFLSQIYTTRKKKQIGVLQQSLREEEIIISNKTSLIQYERIYSQLHIKNTGFSNFDFFTHYQNICEKFGSKQANIQPHLEIKNSLDSSTVVMKNFFENNRKQKEENKYIIRKPRKKIL